MTASLHVAADLGATSGRVLLGRVGPRTLDVQELHRFWNGPISLGGSLHWDVVGLYREVLSGLERLPRGVRSLGIDSWAVDYGLLDEHGQLLGIPYSYRDSRTEGVLDKVHADAPADVLHGLHGLQLLPFTTLYQLAAAQGTAALAAAHRLLLVPDLVAYWLTGVAAAEVTNASTTGLLDVRNRTWSDRLAAIAGIDRRILPPLVAPGTVLGQVRAVVRDQTRFTGDVLTVGSHDTASAVVAVPMQTEAAAYISLGTWGLVGVELEHPVLTREAFDANFTNELGVDGRNRFLRNVTGLFLLSECLHHWRFTSVDRDRLLESAAALPPGPVFDVDDPRLATPGQMPAKVLDVLQDGGWPPPRRKTQLVRAVLDSIAIKLAATVEDAARLSGRDVDVVHVVGGGARNGVLCQLIADHAGRTVVAGPVEATAIGNLLVQARATGTLTGDLDGLRALVASTTTLSTYRPRP